MCVRRVANVVNYQDDPDPDDASDDLLQCGLVRYPMTSFDSNEGNIDYGEGALTQPMAYLINDRVSHRIQNS